MGTPTLHAKISADGQTELARAKRDPDRILTRAAAEAVGKTFWLPVQERGGPPAYDAATHHPPTPTTSIDADQVTDGWAAAVAKTAQEITDEENAEDNGTLATIEVRVLVKLLVAVFQHENAIRTLNSQATITASQFIDGLAGLSDPSDAKLRELVRAIRDAG